MPAGGSCPLHQYRKSRVTLMEADEADAVATKKSHRRELRTPIFISSHLGLVGISENR